MSEILDMMRDVPPQLAAAWGEWLATGLGLLLWHMRARLWEQDDARQRALARTRSRLGVRPPAGGSSTRPAQPAPADPFGVLEALLEPAPGSGSISRRPGD